MAITKRIASEDYVDNALANVSVFVVTVTKDDENNKCTADKTFAEILEAYNDGKEVVCVLNKQSDNSTKILPLCSVLNSLIITFSITASMLSTVVSFTSLGSVSATEVVIQGANDTRLTTEDKTVYGAINELNARPAVQIITWEADD